MLGAGFFFEVLPDILNIYLQYGYLFAHIKYAQMVLIKEAEC